MTGGCAVEGCGDDRDGWATARGGAHGLPAKLAVPVCAGHMEEFGGNAEPLTFERKGGGGGG